MNQKYVIHILVDDAHGDYFFKILLEEPEVMPTIKKYIFDNGAYSKNCLAPYVSSSIPGHTVLLTGVFPNRTNVPYTWYWDVEADPPKALDFSKIQISTIKNWNNAISKDIKTNFEHVPDSASFTVVSRGAKRKFFTIWKVIWAFLLLKIKRVDLTKSRLVFWEYMFLSQLKKLLKKIKKKGLATYTHIVYPPSDSAAHEDGFESQDYRDALHLLDRIIKLLIEGDHSNPKKPTLGLKDLGLLDNCMFIICSDHSSQRFEKIYDILADIRKLPLKVVSINQSGLKKNDSEDADILIAPGAGIFILYIRDPKTRKFTQRLSIDLLESYSKETVMEPINLLKPLLDAEATARLYVYTADDAITVLEPTGSRALIKRRHQGTDLTYSYSSEGEIDPLEYSNDPNVKILVDGHFHSASTWFEKTIHTQYPLQVDQIFRFMDSKHVGAVLVEAKPGWNYVAKGLETAEEKVQDHDTCDRDQIIVPLIISGLGIKKGFEIPYCRNVDIIPTFLEWLNIEYDSSLLDGQSLNNIFE